MNATNPNNAYKVNSGAFRGGLEGAEYQINLLQIFGLRALNKGLRFDLWMEDDAADKFDDVAFCYDSNNQSKFTFLQAKHKVNRVVFELSTLFYEKNFILYKYYKSFELIEENFKVDYGSTDLEDLIVCTNNILPSLSQNDPNCVLMECAPHATFGLHFERQYSHHIFEDEGILFRLDKSKFSENFNILKQYLLAAELVQLLFAKKFDKFYLLEHSKGFLEQNVFNSEFHQV